MNKLILLVSHVGANSSELCRAMSFNKKIHWVNQEIIYDYPIVTNLPTHKYNDYSGIYINEILYNYQITHKGIYKTCQFIYLINKNFNNLDYYIFRLRRIYEMARETKGAIFLTWDDIMNGKGVKLIEDVYDINLSEIKKNFNKNKMAEQAYELCLYRINKLNFLERV